MVGLQVEPTSDMESLPDKL